MLNKLGHKVASIARMAQLAAKTPHGSRWEKLLSALGAVQAWSEQVDRQENRLGRQFGRLHDPHGRRNSKRARFIGRRGNHATSCVVAQACKSPATVGQYKRLLCAASTDDYRLSAQFRVAQEIDGRKKRVHVEMRDTARPRRQESLLVA